MHENLKTRVLGALALPAILLTACTEYTIDTTVNVDGGGVRTERMEAQESGDVNMPPSVFPQIMHTTAANGWSHTSEVDEDGDSIHVFRRRTEVEDLNGWSRLTDRVRISGAVPEKSDARVGYVTLGDVGFHNEVHLRRAADSDGRTSFTYRETFAWSRAADALGEFMMHDLDAGLAAAYPGLSERDRGEIVGFARAGYWSAVDEGLLGGDGDETRLLREVVRRTAGQSIETLRMRYPDAEVEPFTEVLTRSLVDNDDKVAAFLEDDLPGLNAALNSEIIFRLTLPGRVVDSNAHRREGTTLIWEFAPGDALTTPVEIFAESVVGG